MTESLTNRSCNEFTALLGSNEPVPGGGGASALVAAIGVSLCSMVDNFTLGRKKYAAYEEENQKILTEAEALRQRFMELIQTDADAFLPLSRAYSLPKEDPNRAAVMEDATLHACAAPLDIMRCCCRAIELLERLLETGTTMLISDTGCGALFCKAALEAASMNVYVNTKTLTDRQKAEALEDEVAAMLREYLPRAQQTAEKVMSHIH